MRFKAAGRERRLDPVDLRRGGYAAGSTPASEFPPPPASVVKAPRKATARTARRTA